MMVSYKPVRLGDVLVRVSAPATGRDFPVVVFSHGFGWSMDGYAPLADHWAAAGFAVVQPTHPDSRRLGAADPLAPHVWRTRIAQVTEVVSRLGQLPVVVDPSRVAVAGHSWGAQTVSTLLGARVRPDAEDFADPRVTAGVLIAMAGRGGDDLAPAALPFMNPSFATMSAPALIVAGDRDQSPMTVRGPDWLTDGYRLSPQPKDLLTVYGGEHSLGGISGYDVAETTDASPARVALVQRMTTAYLRTALNVDPSAWPVAVKELAADPNPPGRLDARGVATA